MTPLGTGIDTAMALIDSVKLLRGKDADTSGIFDQLNPLIDLVGTGPAFEYTPIQKGIERIPQVALYQGLKHPGEGSKTFPGMRKEALGRYVLGSAYPRVADREERHKQALEKYPAPVRHYFENLQLAEEASKELGIKFTPKDKQELGWERDLEAALDDADIATGDYGHRLRILVDEYARHNPNSSKGLRKWAERVSGDQDAAYSAYLELRKAYTPYWNSYYEQVIKRYEDMIGN